MISLITPRSGCTQLLQNKHGEFLLVLFVPCEDGEAQAAPSLEVFKFRLDGVGIT